MVWMEWFPIDDSAQPGAWHTKVLNECDCNVLGQFWGKNPGKGVELKDIHICLLIWMSLTLSTALLGRCHYYLHSTDEETEAWGGQAWPSWPGT